MIGITILDLVKHVLITDIYLTPTSLHSMNCNVLFINNEAI